MYLKTMEENKSLYAMCLHVMATSTGIEVNKYYLETIPVHVKTALLKLLCKRGLIKDLFVFKNLINSCITSIDLSECEVSDELLCCLSVCKYLQKLDLSLGRKQIRNVSSKVLMSLFEQLKFLKVIIIPHCAEINDEVIDKICQNCTDLRELHIPNCSITDEGLRLIGEKINNLRVINVSKTQISHLGILHLVSGNLSQTIEEINVKECNITPHSSTLTVQKLPNIKYLALSENELLNYSISLVNPKVRQIFWTV